MVNDWPGKRVNTLEYRLIFRTTFVKTERQFLRVPLNRFPTLLFINVTYNVQSGHEAKFNCRFSLFFFQVSANFRRSGRSPPVFSTMAALGGWSGGEGARITGILASSFISNCISS